MGRIRSRDTKPELLVRSLLHRCGFRFSLRNRKLPGTPDVVLTRHRIVVFVHGCFWHQHPGCSQARCPRSRKGYWQAKLARNVGRDRVNAALLGELGWRVVVLWECEVSRDPQVAARRVVAATGAAPSFSYADLPDRAACLEVADARWHQAMRRLGKGSPDYD